jgi:hypothetical protein
MTEPIATAEDLARELLARLPDRLAHTEGVARKAEEAGIERERADVLAAYRRHRDPVRLEAEMARLDEAEQSARSGAEDEGLDPTEAVDFLRNLPALWEEAPNSRRALAESLFESVDVLGLDTMHVEPTPAAVRRGLAEAFRADELVMVGARGFEPPTSSSRTMRAAKLRHAPTENAR